MIEKRGKLVSIFSLLSLFVIFGLSNISANSFLDDNEDFSLLSSNLFLESFNQIDLEQNFLNKTISYEYGKFTPEIMQGEELNNYFKKLDLQEDYIYVLLEFNNSLNGKQTREFKRDNVEEIGKYDKDVYIYKFPKEILETKTYDFIRWIDIPKKGDKMDSELKDSLNSNNSLYIKVEFYEPYSDKELVKINKYSKFINKDTWEEKEIYVLVGPKLNNDSINLVEEIASFNFVKSVKLIDVRDRRQMDLYINQSEFYENKSLINQPHAVVPWQRDDKKFGDLEKYN
jgi:hypothetical protein